MSDDADSMLSEQKTEPSELPSVKYTKMMSFSANNSPFLGRKNLVSKNGSIIWDADGDWIQLYDKMLRMTSSQQRQRACGCLVKRTSEINYQSIYASPQHLRRGTVSLYSNQLFYDLFLDISAVYIITPMCYFLPLLFNVKFNIAS